MSPYRESESFPRGRRLLLVPIALAFLIEPYGTMLAGGPGDPLRWLVTMLSIALCTTILALGLARPRRTIVIDGDARTVRISSTPPPPHFQQVHHERSFDAVTEVAIVEVGVPRTPEHGYRVEVRFGDDPPVLLHRLREESRAQDTVDHLVLLGLPGRSRAAARAASLDAPAPTTWL